MGGIPILGNLHVGTATNSQIDDDKLINSQMGPVPVKDVGMGHLLPMNLPYDWGFIYSHPAIPAMTLGTMRVPGFWLITTWFKHVELAIHGIFMHFSRLFHIFNLIGFTMKHSKSFVWWTIKLVDRQEDGIIFLMGRNEEPRFFEPSTRFCWENHKI